MIGPHTRLMMLSFARECVMAMKGFQKHKMTKATQDNTKYHKRRQHNTTQQKARLHKAKQDNTRELSTAQLSTTQHDTRTQDNP
jgi:hypothetical protein